jgi:hypothetical protein
LHDELILDKGQSAYNMKDIRCMDIPIPCRLFEVFVLNNDGDAAQEAVPVDKLSIILFEDL